MRSIFLRMGAVALTLSLGFTAGSANAATVAVDPWVPISGTGLQGAFNYAPGSGSFTDWIWFNIPSGASGSGDTFVGKVTTTGPISFSSFELFAWTGLVPTGPALFTGTTYAPPVTPFNQAYLTFTGLAVPGNYALVLSGTGSATGASYTGQVGVSPVPEPETYAMLLAGLGLMGFSARRRGSNS